MNITTDPNHPDLQRGPDEVQPTSQNSVYLVLSEEERAKGFVRPLRHAYVHDECNSITTMELALCETYARNPRFYGYTYCCHCQGHFPVNEFHWVEDGEVVGS